MNHLRSRYHVVEVPAGTGVALAGYGSPVAWLIGGATPVNPATLAQLPELRLISNFGVGIDHIDVGAATAARVVVTNTPGVLDGAVAEFTVGLILCIGRGIASADRHVRSGGWSSAVPLAHDLNGAVLGIVGLGRIGRRLAQLAQPFGLRVLYHNRRRDARAEDEGLAEYVSRENLLRQADFVSLHTPLTEQTRGFFGPADLAAMKKTAFLINTARGAIVDEAALVRALSEHLIAGAALDVFADEPLPAGHPLLGMDNVVLTPHIGSGTVQARRAMIELAVRNLIAGADGARPETPVNASWAQTAGGLGWNGTARCVQGQRRAASRQRRNAVPPITAKSPASANPASLASTEASPSTTGLCQPATSDSSAAAANTATARADTTPRPVTTRL
jgi:lactate dehydrogenase-like 2-hydroxyacid dehydrogenase